MELKQALQTIANSKPYLLNNRQDNIKSKWLYPYELDNLTTEDLVILLKLCNLAYRLGTELVSNTIYDTVLRAELQRREPQHPYLHTVEPEPLTEKTVALPIPMLSTKKVYSKEEVAMWIAKVLKVALTLNIPMDQILWIPDIR